MCFCVCGEGREERREKREGRKRGGKDVGNVVVKERMCSNYFFK